MMCQRYQTPLLSAAFAIAFVYCAYLLLLPEGLSMWENFGEVLRPASLPPGNSPPPLTPRPGGKGAVSLFTREDYLEVRRGSPEEDFSAKLCKNVTFFEEKDKVPPRYTLCMHPKNKSIYPSIYFPGNVAEPGVTRQLHRLMEILEAKFPRTLYLDMGTNVGIHVMPMLAAGHTVWGLDAQRKNLAKVYQAASDTNVDKRLTLIHNALTDKTGISTYVHVHKTFNAISRVSTDGKANRANNNFDSQAVRTVRLADVVEEVIASVPGDHNVSAVLKLDIERHECRAIAGSPEAFANPRMFIAYMSMEWAYKDGESVICPAALRRSMTRLLRSAGYSAFSGDGEVLDDAKLERWDSPSVIWKHQSAPSPWKDSR